MTVVDDGPVRLDLRETARLTAADYVAQAAPVLAIPLAFEVARVADPDEAVGVLLLRVVDAVDPSLADRLERRWPSLARGTSSAAVVTGALECVEGRADELLAAAMSAAAIGGNT